MNTSSPELPRLRAIRLRSTAYHIVDASLGPWIRCHGRPGHEPFGAMPACIS